MPQSQNSPDIERLISLIAKLPGLGPRSARRAVLELIRKRDSLMRPLAEALTRTADNIKTCTRCGNIDAQDPCSICQAPGRDSSIICVLQDVGDLWAMERAKAFKGLYHVLGGTLSAIDGIRPEDLRIAELVERVRAEPIKEVILAMNATVDGQTTAHYITDHLSRMNVAITRLAHGVPVGGELDYLDDGTIHAALTSRRPF